MNNQEAKSFLETMYSYVDKKMQSVNSSVAKVVGGQITGTTSSGRYKVKINAFDDEEISIFPINHDENYEKTIYSLNVETNRYPDGDNEYRDFVTGVELEPKATTTTKKRYNIGDYVFVLYWGDLTNAKILCKNM